MAVTIESLDYWNGFTYRECHVPLLRQGLVYLNGKNGHGKSTPFEVLQHMLFGTTSRGVRKDGIICAVPDSDGFHGELVLSNPDGRWLIRQSRNHSVHKTAVKVLKEVDGQWSTSWDGGGCPKKLDDAQKLAGNLLGLQPHEFAGCMYLSQASAHTLIEGTPSDKMRYIAQLFGIDICDRVVTALRGDLKEAVKLTVDVPLLQQQLEQQRAEAAAYDVPQPHDFAVLQSARDVAVERRTALRDLIYDERDRIASVQQRQELQRERDELGNVGDSDALRLKAGKLDAKRDTMKDTLRVYGERRRLEAALSEIKDVASSAELTSQIQRDGEVLREWKSRLSLLQRRATFEAEIERLQYDGEDVARIREDVERHRSQHATMSATLYGKSQELAKLRRTIQDCREGRCPTCHQALDVAQLGQLAAQLESESQDLEHQILDAKNRQEHATRRLLIAEQHARMVDEISRLPGGNVEDVEHGIERLNSAVATAERRRLDVLKREEMERRLAGLPPSSDVRQQLARTEMLLEAVQQEIVRAERAELLDRKLGGLEAVDVERAHRTVALAEDALEHLEAAVEVIQERQVKAQVAADDYRDLCASIQELDGQLALLAGPRERVKVLEASVAAIQKLKRRKLHQVVEAIRDCLPRFASTMFSHEPSTRFSVSSDDESLDLICRRRVGHHGVDIAVKSLSGGEKQRLSVALVFTLHALLHARKRPDLLILDEVDRGLDDVGIASLMSLVRSVRQQYGTVIMTSHRSQIAGAAFDRTWTVTKTDEVSRLQLDGGPACSA